MYTAFRISPKEAYTYIYIYIYIDVLIMFYIFPTGSDVDSAPAGKQLHNI